MNINDSPICIGNWFHVGFFFFFFFNEKNVHWFTKISKASMLLPVPKSMMFPFTVPTTLAKI
jgi:hypothetical protein